MEKAFKMPIGLISKVGTTKGLQQIHKYLNKAENPKAHGTLYLNAENRSNARKYI